MLNADNNLLIVIDIQEKLTKVAFNGNNIAENANKLATAANILSIPIIATEQYPKGLGNTVEKLKSNINKDNIIEKTAFSAMKEDPFSKKIHDFNKKQIYICGIETHICVLQTALDLIKKGYEVFIVKDATSSRYESDYQAGLELLKQYGVKITCTEIVLFQWLETSKNPHFKEIQSLIK